MARNNYGLFLCNRGRIDEALEQFRLAVKNRMFGWSLDEAFGEAVNNMKHLTLDEVAVMWMVTASWRSSLPHLHPGGKNQDSDLNNSICSTAANSAPRNKIKLEK